MSLQRGQRGNTCHGYGHFQADCPNRRTFSFSEVEQIQAIEKETEEQSEEDDHTLTTSDLRELLVIQIALHAKEVPLELS